MNKHGMDTVGNYPLKETIYPMEGHIILLSQMVSRRSRNHPLVGHQGTNLLVFFR